MTDVQPESASTRSSPAALLCLVVVLALTALLRAGLLDVPLERDEGEYAYVAQRMLAGEAPYSAAYTLKLPGTHLAYALSMTVFGESVRGIRIGFLLMHTTTLALIFVLGRRLAGPWSGVAAAVCYAALSTHSAVLGQAAHATHYVVFFALAAFALAPEGPPQARGLRWLGIGLLLGCAVLMKQAGVFLALFGLAVPLLHYRESVSSARRATLLAIAGAVIPLVATLGILAALGVFDTFWFWTVTYASEYASTTVAPAAALANLRMAAANVLGPAWALWALGALGLLFSVFDTTLAKQRAWLLGLLLCSVLALLPGFQFRRHYFVLLLPVVALLAGVGVTALARHLPGRIGALAGGVLLLAATATTAAGDRAFLWDASPHETSRALYGTNPFPEAEQIADQIAARSAEGDEIAVFGSEPEIPFLAGRRSATGFLYVYGLMEEHSFAARMQRDMIDEVQAAAPRFVVYVETPSSWLQQPESDTHILDWVRPWLDLEYEWIGAVEVLSPTETAYYWDEATAEFQPRSPNYVLVFRRR